MRPGALIDTSITAALLRKTRRYYSYFGESLRSASHTSLVYMAMLRSWGKVKIYFRYSFLGRASEADKPDAAFTISESKIIKGIRDFCGKWNKDFPFYFKASILNKLRAGFKNEFYSSPLKAVSAVIIVSTLTNLFLTVLLKGELAISGWIIRALLLFAGLAGLNSHAGWPDIQNDSIILKLILRKKCAGYAGR